MGLRVVTVPPAVRGASAIVEWAARARSRGAEVIELRNDLHDADAVDVEALARGGRVLVAQRGRALDPRWVQAAWKVDLPLGAQTASVSEDKLLLSLHADAAMAPRNAEALWMAARVPRHAWVKHVEPLGALSEANRVFETQQLLGRAFGAATTLLMGSEAVAFRALAAGKNALDYLAADPNWMAAPGQRFLADAVRAGGAGGPRLGIIGTAIGASRSPRVHAPPFDRIELPDDTDVAALLDALLPHYRGLAVTSPFKKRAAAAVRAELASVNCLSRDGNRWRATNTDVAGARVALRRFGAKAVKVLGDGGATEALRLAVLDEGVELEVVRRGDLGGAVVGGACIWTWPESVAPPGSLRFRAGTDVGIIAYGGRARRIASVIRALGGRPRFLGAAWFCAQAQAQRALWESAR